MFITQRELEEINRQMNEELFNNLEKQYQEVRKTAVNYESSKNDKQRKDEGK